MSLTEQILFVGVGAATVSGLALLALVWLLHQAKAGGAEDQPYAPPFPTPKKARYALCPGEVVSQTDGDVHFVGAQALATLYEVPMAECVVMHPTDRADDPRFRGLPRLKPRYDGDYNWITVPCP